MKKINIGGYAKGAGHSILTWEWTKRLLYWLIISAGTMSELVFLVASLWVSINANVHAFVLLFLPESVTIHITELATTAYVALPECIVGLAVVVTISHVRLWLSNKKDYRPFIWIVLYGLPTAVFLVLSLITLGNAVASVNFQMPTPLIVVRALAAFMFAFTSLIYTQLGLPQEKDRLAKKDALLEDLRREKDTKIADLARETGAKIADLEKENARLANLISQQNQDLQEQKKQQSELLNALDKSTKSALQAYSQECQDWLMSGIKSVLVDEIVRFSGHSKRKVNKAIADGKIQSTPRNENKFLITSVIEWLEQNPPSAEPDLYVVNG
jgi:hypothetical protein